MVYFTSYTFPWHISPHTHFPCIFYHLHISLLYFTTNTFPFYILPYTHIPCIFHHIHISIVYFVTNQISSYVSPHTHFCSISYLLHFALLFQSHIFQVYFNSNTFPTIPSTFTQSCGNFSSNTFPWYILPLTRIP